VIWGKTWEQQRIEARNKDSLQMAEDLRWKDKFAWFPVQLENGLYIWLQNYREQITGYLHYGVWNRVKTIRRP
jgi:hypothetical protein